MRVALLYPGDHQARLNATAENNRFADLFRAFAGQGVSAEPAVYHDDYAGEVLEQLLQLDGVLVWVNPVEGGRDRSVLDATLRRVASAGIFVSAHPDVILKLGTKEVLYRTRNLGWGCDTHLYTSLDQLRHELPARLASGKARVLKQHRGNGGNGVWQVQLPIRPVAAEDNGGPVALPQPDTIVRVRHAKRGSIEEAIPLGEFYGRCAQYFTSANGRMIDQEFQERLPDGMVRCYLVHDRVVGFGHQAVNALYPAPAGAAPVDAPQPGPRLYFPPTKPEFQALKQELEHEWLPAAQQLLAIGTQSLPILWDCDFLYGPASASGQDTYVLGEINVSSVAPYPESAVTPVVGATIALVGATRRARGLAS